MVQQMNQKSKDEASQISDMCSKKDLEPEGHISSNCTRKRERHPTVMVEYGDHELQALLDLEKPKKKKGKGVASKVYVINKEPKRDFSQI